MMYLGFPARFGLRNHFHIHKEFLALEEAAHGARTQSYIGVVLVADVCDFLLPLSYYVLR